ncbi:MAG: hypothetical protein ACREO5_00995 [Candidatus Binatia bacterium]
MINKSNISRVLGVSLALAGSILVLGSAAEVNAQSGRDPFVKPGYMRQNTQSQSTPGGKASKSSSTASDAPSIEQRIEYYKRLREQAASAGAPLPKVTSVLTLNEMAVTGIFHTPRGYAAMVEAVPIKLSYTIYPGERFFDGQLVAVEENRLVFRRVVKMGNGKFVSSVENKALRQYSTKSLVEGTAPTQAVDRSAEQASTPAPASTDTATAKPAVIVSPLDEMNKQLPETDKAKSAKNAKKPTKVAKNK